MYMFFFGRRMSSNPFCFATNAMTCRQLAGALSLNAGMGSIAHILHLGDSVIAETRRHLLFQNEMPSLPERLERALVSNTLAVPAILTTPNVAPPVEKS